MERLMSTDGRKQMRMSSRNATRQAAQLCQSPDRPMSQHSRKWEKCSDQIKHSHAFFLLRRFERCQYECGSKTDDDVKKDGWPKFVSFVCCHYIPRQHRSHHTSLAQLEPIFMFTRNCRSVTKTVQRDAFTHSQRRVRHLQRWWCSRFSPHSWGCDPPFGRGTPAAGIARGVRGDHHGVLNAVLLRDDDQGDDCFDLIGLDLYQFEVTSMLTSPSSQS